MKNDVCTKDAEILPSFWRFTVLKVQFKAFKTSNFQFYRNLEIGMSFARCLTQKETECIDTFQIKKKSRRIYIKIKKSMAHPYFPLKVVVVIEHSFVLISGCRPFSRTILLLQRRPARRLLLLRNGHLETRFFFTKYGN